MSDLVKTFDGWLADAGPAALVIREHLMPVEGQDAVLFPATFAAAEDKAKFAGGYNIDGPFDGQPDGENVCLIDSVGSQANRVEPEFGKEPYAGLVPQIAIKAGGRTVSLLEAGHRAGDAIARCTELAGPIHEAFKQVLRGNTVELAKIAPTSVVFGVWDSRNTQARLPRLVNSTIRAFNVRRLTRGAQFVPVIDYVAEGVLEEASSKAVKDKYAQKGFTHVPSAATPGGVIATGGVRRDATLNLAAIRRLMAGSDQAQTLALRRYILGLSLVAFTHPSAFVGYLRQGCTLVLDPDAKPAPREFSLVEPDGTRRPQTLTHAEALAYAKVAAEKFGVGPSKTVEFDKSRAKDDVDDAKAEKKGAKGKRAADAGE
ncbi:MAG: type I-U CRISPR-associated RAMP protein Csb1/Cas7u [bacterium]|jgi:CRISPR-associated protein Csb1|nr:type I-U CRISPR-associated protein Cas7 [Phycisphaerales bacterium]MCE2654590.1 type I-U CRISPR-associated RAMP protein Csb1/Cas7u [Planctomycetaceae bacterium]